MLGLLPTGAGKSICYQVPGLFFGGITLVVSPLIALIKDQVEQLRKVGVNSQSIHAGLAKIEIDAILNGCIHDETVQFLFVSPERLHSKLFLERLGFMNVTFLVIDEAHCISQWGYDFRPLYLKISQVIKRFKNQSIPILALTASATPDVQKDIIDKLELGKDVFVYKGEFSRENLSLNVRLVEDKYIKLVEILRVVEGSSIVYVTSRKMAEHVARFLDSSRISTLYYHAGLSSEDRAKRQYLWLNNRVRVIVATNAFGMGIDKSNVRTVIHFQLPSSLEGYYQEVGRAGRDGKKSYAVLLFNKEDELQLTKRFEDNYPKIENLIEVYNALGNYYKLALGVTPLASFNFYIDEISSIYNISISSFYYALKRLENIGLIALNDAFKSASRVKVLLNHQELYQYQVANLESERLLKAVIRTYGSDIFVEYVKINELLLANEIGKGKQFVIDQLVFLVEQKVIDFQTTNQNPQITFLIARCGGDKLRSLYYNVEILKKNRKYALNQFIKYLKTTECRSVSIARYFGFSVSSCGVCDICISNQSSRTLRENIVNNIKINGKISLTRLIRKLFEFPEEKIKKELRLMIDLGLVKINDQAELWL